VTFVVYPPEDEQLGLQALQANIIYAWDGQVPTDIINVGIPPPDVEVTTVPGDKYRMFNINCNRFPTNITGYRQAIACALDKGAVIQASTGGLAFFQDSAIPITLGNWTYESQLSETYYAQDINKANASLEAAGFRDLNADGWREYDKNNNSFWDSGIDLNSIECAIEFNHNAGHAPSGNAATLAVDGLAKCGIRAYVNPIDPYEFSHPSWWELRQQGLWWVECLTFTNMVSADLLYDLFHSSTGNNQWYFGGWTNTTYDVASEALMAAATEEEAQYWSWICQEILWHELPMIVCYNDVYTHAYRTDIWEGYINMQGRNRIANGYSLVHIKLKEEAGGPFGCYPTEYIMSLNEGLDTTNWLMSNSKHTDKVFQLVYEELTTISPYDWTYQPSLAYAWETEATNASGDIQDGEKYTFHLYENATWHDGMPVTASDVAFSLSLGLLDPYDSENYANVYMTNIIDNKTIEIYTNATGYFEWAQATGFTVYPAYIWSIPPNLSAWEPTSLELVGSGPYIFTAYVPGQYVVLERHPDWHFAVPQPERPYCLIGDDFSLGHLIFAGFLIIVIQVIILSYLLHRRSKNKSIKNSTHYYSTQWRVD
jgi:ABC-type transport system substrate-binding protein